MLHQFARQAEGEIEAADPGMGARSQSAKAASDSNFSRRVSCTRPPEVAPMSRMGLRRVGVLEKSQPTSTARG